MTRPSPYRTLDPATEALVATYPLAAEDEVRSALARAERAYAGWRRSPAAERRALLEAVAEALEREADGLAQTMALEMGKPLAEGVAEARKCAWVCRYYAEHGERFLAPRTAESDGRSAAVRFDPLGPILAIMPWNFPFWQVFRAAAPALAAGNPVLLKHAPNTPRCGLEIERLFREAGAPDGLFVDLFLSNEQAARVIADPTVRGVTLTGSTRAGREVARIAGERLKPMVLELGGSDPFIVFGDADLGAAAAVGAASRCLNSGQSCIAAKRFVVERRIADEFVEALTDELEKRPVGDPRTPSTAIGPMAREDLRDHLARQVAAAEAAGAQTAFRGAVPNGPGFYHPAVILTGLDPLSEEAAEELFGPVATVFAFDGEAEALEIANATPYGLGAALWTADRERVRRLIPDLDAGSVFVNGMVKSDPRLPFGGIKDSGFGRELGRDGLLEFVNTKTVWIG